MLAKSLVSKPILIFQLTFFTLLLMLSPNAKAEYYMVYSEDPVVQCVDTCNPCYQYHYIRVSSPHRHAPSRGEGQTSEYAWIGDP